jgi:organic hydroperoxide reductase OsmC/OhrA
MEKLHHYKVEIQWTGNKGSGTDHYTHYERDYNVIIGSKPILHGSSDPAFRGDEEKYNPEDLLLSALSSCHMLWYLHLCSVAGVVVEEYTDHSTGIMEERKDGSGCFTEVVLNPRVIVSLESMLSKATELHTIANKMCFIANSVNFPVKHFPEIIVSLQ